ncbi:MAG: histidine--tRNA ligase [Candidatus Diapherotrites archaeon]
MAFDVVRGMRDFPPELARKKQWIEDRCREIFELYGFEPLETPVVETLELLTKKGGAGSSIEDEIYAFEDKGGRKLGLRFDLTVPLARFVASSKDLPIPFKRYQIGRVYRYDRPQAKRYREFTQADADIIGVSSVLAEVELIALSYDLMKALGTDAKLFLNSRKILESLAIAFGIKQEKLSDCFRIIDKVEKIGWSEVERDLESKEINTEILDVIQKNDLASAKEVIIEKKQSIDGIKRLEELLDYVNILGLSDFVNVELSLARGLDYYTDTVMELKTSEGPSIGGGGRYDNLIERYGGRKLCATGISFGVDRILDTIEKKIIAEKVKTKIFVSTLGDEYIKVALDIVSKLRKAGISTELDLMQRGISKNLEYASKKGIPFFIILGPKELSQGKLKLRNMVTGQEKLIDISSIDAIKKEIL